MKKKLFIVILLSFLLVGCSINKNSEYFNGVSGTYELVSVKDDQANYSENVIKKIKEAYQLILRDDGTAILVIDRNKYKLTYDKDYLFYVDENAKKQKIDYKYINGVITVYVNNTIYKFSLK